MGCSSGQIASVAQKAISPRQSRSKRVRPGALLYCMAGEVIELYRMHDCGWFDADVQKVVAKATSVALVWGLTLGTCRAGPDKLIVRLQRSL